MKNLKNFIKSQSKKSDRGITLIALIITIIILVILAAVSIRAVYNMGIVGHAINGSQDYSTKAKEENEMLGNTGNTIDSALAKLKEIQGGNGGSGGSSTGGNTGSESSTGENTGTDSNDIYRGQATASEANQELYFYDILSEPATGYKTGTEIASTTPLRLGETSTSGTAKIAGINLEYVFTQAFGQNQNEWPSFSSDSSSGSNSQYINAMKPYVSKLVIPAEVTLNNKKYKITQIDELFTPDNREKTVSEPGSGDYNVQIWGTGSSDVGYLWKNPDLGMNIIFPENVSFGSDFRFESSVNTISLPSNMQSINDSMFSGCENITSIKIPSTVTSIGSDAFYNCYSLTSITAPVGVSSSSWPSSIETFTINGGTSIGSYEFSGCSNLTSITVPSTVTSIGENAFESCSNLTNITAPVGISYSSWPSSVQTFTINGGTSIKYQEFYNCSNLTSITIPNTVTSIGDNAFEDSGLTSITIPSTVTSIGSNVFYNCSSDLTITTPISLINSSFDIGNLIITNGTTINNSMFSGFSNIRSIYLPDSITSIANKAFENCSNLQELSIPSNLIGSGSDYEKWGVSASVVKPRTVE